MRPPNISPETFLAAVEAELFRRAKSSLYAFIRLAWPTFEFNKFVPGRHLEVMAARLEAVNRGECRRLLVNTAPRHTKSDLIGVCWPAWTWLQDDRGWPLGGSWVQFLFASHSFDLAVRDSRRCRALIQSPWYQDLCEGRIQLREDGGQAMHAWDLVTGGARRSTSIDSRVTGFGSDIQVGEDVHDVREVESAAAREAARVFWQESLPSRINDPRNHARVLSGQRVHAKDLSALVLESGEGWEHLCLPGLYDPEHPMPCVHDWRKEPGEVLWAERFPTRIEYDALAGTAYARAAQVQQNPQMRGAGIFAKAQWQFADDYPRAVRLARYWDKAATAEGQGSDPDYTAGVLGGFDRDGLFWIVDVVRGRWSSHQVEQRIGLTAREIDGTGVGIWIEQEPGASGVDSIAHYQRLLRGHAVRGDRATGAKLVRVDPFLAAAEAGNVVLVRRRWIGNGQGLGPEPATWHANFLAECDEFTGDDSVHDDQVVAATGCFNRMATVRGQFSTGRLLGV